MKDIEASSKLELQIIHPENHHNRREIYQEFIKNGKTQRLETNPVCSIDDFGLFYKDCLDDFRIYRPDIVVCLGDRWEMLAAATAALLLNIPIVHIAGAETTLGAFDNEIRNAISMMSSYHFTSNIKYAEKLSKMIYKPFIDLIGGQTNEHSNNKG
jgi:UDP-N-acetylglucosamine 2-epimerase